MSDNTEAIGRELVTLIRGSKDLHAGLTDPDHPVLDPPALVLLARIDEQGPVRLSALAGCVHLDVSTISRQVHDLENAGWVARERDTHDGRASLLRLSPEGSLVLAAGRRQRAEALRQVLAGWTEPELQDLAGQLARFNDALSTFRTAADSRTTGEARTTARQEIS